MGNLLVRCFPKRPDGTAMGVAKVRFQEVLAPNDVEPICSPDPYASGVIIGAWAMTFMGYKKLYQMWAEIMPGGYESLLCRTKFLDDHVSDAILHGGVEQVVILGAGYDMRFYRLECFRKEGLCLIEVDQPVVQKRKKDCLQSMGVLGSKPVLKVGNENHQVETSVRHDETSWLFCSGLGASDENTHDGVETYEYLNKPITKEMITDSIACKLQITEPKNPNTRVQFCPCNFETMNLKDQLRKTTFEPSKKSVFVLEGLTQYVDKAALTETLRTLNELCETPGSILLLSYVDRRTFGSADKVGEIVDLEIDPGGEKLKNFLEMVRISGEPWITSFDVTGPDSMQAWLSTNSKFTSNYQDESWTEFSETVLQPKSRCNGISNWGVERHVHVERSN